VKLVEESEGEGNLTIRGTPVGTVPYALARYQAMTAGGLPVPGLHRIEGRLQLDRLGSELALERDMHLSLDLEDGRRLDLTLLDTDGRVLAEGHGPGKCGCC
jgi:hypothetical protein